MAKMKRILPVLLLLCALGPATSSCLAEDSVDAADWVRRGDELLRGKTHSMDLTLRVKTPDWERSYELSSWMNGTEETFVRVLGPARVKGQGFLKQKTRLWNYLPTAERTILIPPSLMLEDFMGSDFSNDDFVKMSYLVRDYTHKLLGEDAIDGVEAYRFELLPKPDAAVVYGKLVMWSRKKDAGPLRTEFYDEKLALIRTLHYSDYRPAGEGGPQYPFTWRMENHAEPGNDTWITIHRAEFGAPLDPSIFTRENLENPR